MDVLTFYSIGFGAVLAAPLVPGLYALFCRHVVPLFRCQLAKIRYRRVGGFTRLHLFRGATCVELLLVSAYIAGNGIAVALKAVRGATITNSAALAASINLIPLLLGGRTSRVADVIGVSRPAYYVAHQWIGCTAIIEGLVHAAVRLDEARQSQRSDPIVVSGCVVRLFFSSQGPQADDEYIGPSQLPYHPLTVLAMAETQARSGISRHAPHSLPRRHGGSGLARSAHPEPLA